MKIQFFRKCFSAILIPAIFLTACSNKPNEKGEYVIKPNDQSKEVHIKYQDNGSIDYIQEYTGGNAEGLFVTFKKGSVKNISTVKDGENNGCGLVFHSNGLLNNFGQYVNGAKTGWFYVFDKNGTLSNKREYVSVGGKEYLNQWIDYKPDGSIDKLTSNFIKVIPVKDTIMQDEEYQLNVSLEAAFFKQYMVMAIGEYDENFNLPAGAKCDTIKSSDFVATYKTKIYKKGVNLIRGMVLDLQPDIKDPKKVNIRKIYFSHEFRVR
jgi:hypothetical protein